MSEYTQAFIVTLNTGAVVKAVVSAEQGRGESEAIDAAIALFAEPHTIDAPQAWDVCAFPTAIGMPTGATILAM
jgi:hypothetical protein